MTTKEKFLAALDVVHSIPQDGTFEPSEEMVLKLYAYEKQATVGPNDAPKPFVWNIAALKQWHAWNDLGVMPQETAMICYIEELAKVIEVMSYNEKISKFVSLMGPFFEVVSSDETDSQKDRTKWEEKLVSPPSAEDYHHLTISELYNMPKTVMEQSPEARSEKSPFLRVPVQLISSSSSSTSSTSETSNFDLLSDISDSDSSPPTRREMFSSVQKKDYKKSCHFFTEKDFLLLAIINLQTSFEEILKKLDCLLHLAESTNINNSAVAREDMLRDKWSLNCAGTAFALLWPVAVELYFQAFRK